MKRESLRRKRRLQHSLVSLLTILLFNCGGDVITNDNDQEIYRAPLELYMQYPLDDLGYYHVEYSGYNYTQVFARSEGTQRIFWSSSDSFSVVYNGIEFHTAIASYSTYTNSQTGETRQNVYINSNSVGDTLAVVGAISSDNYRWVQFIVE